MMGAMFNIWTGQPNGVTWMRIYSTPCSES